MSHAICTTAPGSCSRRSVTAARSAVVKYNIAEILSDQGHWTSAERLLREAIRVWRASGADTDVAEGRRELGKAIGRRGDIETALALLNEARVTQVSHNLPGEVLATDTRTAEVLVIAGRSTEASRPWRPTPSPRRRDRRRLHRRPGAPSRPRLGRAPARRAERIPRVIHGRPATWRRPAATTIRPRSHSPGSSPSASGSGVDVSDLQRELKVDDPAPGHRVPPPRTRVSSRRSRP